MAACKTRTKSLWIFQKAFEKSMQQMLKESSIKEVFLTTSQERVELFKRRFHHNF